MPFFRYLAFILVFLFYGEAIAKIRVPVRECEKPISLPSSFWCLGGEGSLYFALPLDTGRYVNVSDMNTAAASPFLLTGNILELHPLFPEIRLFLLKKTKVVDSIEQISGANIAIGLKFAGISFTAGENTVSASGGVYHLLRAPLFSSNWIEWNGRLTVSTLQDYIFREDLLLGCQLTDIASLSTGISLGRYGDFSEGNKPEYSRIEVPLRFRFNITSWCNFGFGSGLSYLWGDNRKFIGIPLYILLSFQW